MLPSRARAQANDYDNDPVSLEMAASLARSGFACMFSTSDEYESALIAARRAEGRYRKPRRLPAALFAGSVTTMAAIWLFALS